ncbi:MAG: hypothetical protein ACJAWV_000791 [Flammeovirgaceae bacterium]|jgi:Ca-activated chloride channel family protein
MKNLLILLLFAIIDAIPGSKIALVNEHKSQAEIAMKEKDYEKAIENYSFLVDSLDLEDEGLKLNLAHSFYLDFKNKAEETKDQKLSEDETKGLSEAINRYESLKNSDEKIIKGKANNQLGNIAMMATVYKEAVPYFKEALKAEPMNEEYRYNYELAKKLAEEQEKKEEDNKDKNKDEKKDDKEEEKSEEEKKKEEEQKKEGDKKDEDKKGENEEKDSKNEQEKKDAEKEKEGKEGEEKDNKEGEKGEEKAKEKKEGEKEGDKGEKEGADGKEGEKSEKQKKEDIKKAMQKRLQNINMTDEKAKMILNAMKNQEKQYYQQMQRGKKQKKDKSKPDW